MAEFIPIDKDKYRIVGKLTEDDINMINAFKNRTTLILKNTVGLSSELVSKIESDRVVFSIKGGLDYDIKEKYKSQKYVDRTFVSPSGLKKIIKYFEYNESMIDPNWNEFEKAMFLYNALCVDMEYSEDYETIQSPGTTERSLNGILYGKLVCAGFAQVYKEMLDRVGIKNYYQNQRDVHAFNVIEIEGKKYGVDITWDNNDKKNNNNKCCFARFGQDPNFYTRHGHQLYTEELDFDSEDVFKTKRVYDTDEEIYDLSVLSVEQLNEYYSHIVSRINGRKPFKYNLQDQSLEIKNKYLPVDIVDIKLKQEASEEYIVIILLDFLKKRNAIQIDSKLLDAFSYRKGYISDVGNLDGKYNFSVDLSLIGINNYEIDRGGNITFEKDNERRHSFIWGINVANSNMSEAELNYLYGQLNQYIAHYLKKYILNILDNIDNLLANYEYKPDEWDSDRALESTNIYSKLAIVVNSRDYLKQLGLSEKDIDNIINRITTKYNEIHKPYEINYNQKNQDLDFLSALFDDLDLVKKTIEYDLQKQISDGEFAFLYCNVDYMIQLFEKYIIVAGDKKFKFDEYDVSKEDLQQLLNRIIRDNKYIINETNEYTEDHNSIIHR